MEVATAEMRRLKINKHEIKNGFALVIVNKQFKTLRNRDSADVDRKNLEEFCRMANFTFNDISGLKKFSEEKNSEQQQLIDTSELKFTDKNDLTTYDLTAEEMSNLFRAISKGDFTQYDGFICFISSHGNAKGICGIDGDTISFNEILRSLKSCVSLVGTPKLFFIQMCRGCEKDRGVRSSVVVPDQGNAISITVPTEADILVAYSSVDGYESYRDEKKGSWFITQLTDVLKENAHDMNLMEMLVITAEMVAREESNGRKQMPCFTSTLRMAVKFKICSHTQLGAIPPQP